MCHVLIIEDEALVAMDIEMLLESQGATSFAFAATEEDAVASARDSHPGLITSDVRLLAGWGPVAVQRIIAELGSIPVIFITGTPRECTPCAQPSVVLTKPLKRGALTDAYRRLVDDEGMMRSAV